MARLTESVVEQAGLDLGGLFHRNPDATAAHTGGGVLVIDEVQALIDECPTTESVVEEMEPETCRVYLAEFDAQAEEARPGEAEDAQAGVAP